MRCRSKACREKGRACRAALAPHARCMLTTTFLILAVPSRLVAEMQQNAALQRLRGKAVLVLDTTYCDPQYTFPSQQDVLKFTLGKD